MKAEIRNKFYFGFFRHHSNSGIRAFSPEDRLSVTVHPSSVNHAVVGLPSPYITYFSKRLSTSIYLHDTTCVTVPILLFASADIFISR